MEWIIYGYKKRNINKIVYVGQTSNISYRRYKHEKYDPFAINIVEYEYPLSRGIRKYGIDNYEFIILEDNISSAELAIEREQYWIKFYNTYKEGYNQTSGGKAPKYIKFNVETIELAKKMIKDGYSFKFIQESTNISISHLSEINTGKRHFDNNEQYTLCNKTQNRKLSADQICEIYYLLSNTKESQTSIAKKFGVTQATISNINYGKRYKQFNQQYPIR